jgi:hypothetical protein
MNRMKKFSLQMVVIVGMTLAMSGLGMAQQETMPDHLRGDDEIAAQAATQSKDKDKVQVANSQRQSKTRKHKQLAKRNDSQQQTTVIARK